MKCTWRYEQGRYDPMKHGPLARGRKKQIGLTRWEVGNFSVPVAPMGDFVWRLTKQVVLNGPLQYAQGRTQHKWVYYRRGNKLFTRPWVAPSNPRTGFQTDQRQRLVDAQREWRHLFEWQRNAWALAAKQLTKGPVHSDMGAGQNLFVAAQIQRLSWGEGMRHDPPAGVAQGRRAKRPGSVYHLSEVALAQGEGLALRVEHMQKDIAGCKLLVEMTPATKSPKNKPLERWLTKAGPTDAGSYFELAQSGATYVLPQPRYEVAPGQRFAVRVAIVDSDGLRGKARMVDLIRQEPTELRNAEFGMRNSSNAECGLRIAEIGMGARMPSSASRPHRATLSCEAGSVADHCDDCGEGVACDRCAGADSNAMRAKQELGVPRRGSP